MPQQVPIRDFLSELSDILESSLQRAKMLLPDVVLHSRLFVPFEALELLVKLLDHNLHV